MQELIHITTDEQGSSVVSARELHTYLESRQQFADWIKARIRQYDFIEGRDYVTLSENYKFEPNEVFHKTMKNSKGGRVAIDYALTLDMAKEMAMVERTEKGKQARQYFIEAEKALRHIQSLSAAGTEQRLIQAMQQQSELLAETQRLLAQLRADVDQLRNTSKPPQAQAKSTAPSIHRGLQPGNLREQIQRRINNYCAYHHAEFDQTYTYLYRRLNDVYGVNVHRLNRGEGENLLDTIERYGRLPELHKLTVNELVYPGSDATVVASTAPIKKPTLDTMSPRDLQAIIRRAFSEEEPLRYALLLANIREASEFVGVRLGKTRAEVFIRRALKLGYLLNNWEPGQRYITYRPNLTQLAL